MQDQADSLRQVADNLLREWPRGERGNNCRVIAITSGKGGVGKTNVAVNLSLALCEAGARVLLLDADLGLANVDVLLGLSPQFTLQHLVYHKAELEQVVIQGPLGLDVLPGGSGITELANLNTLEIVRLLSTLRTLERQHDVLVIDTAAGIGNSVLRFLLVADDVVLVSTPEPPALLDAYGVLKALHAKAVHGNTYLLMNMARKATDGSEAYQILSSLANRYLEMRLHYLGSLPLDLAVVQAVKQQRPFYTSAPQAPVSCALRELAAQFLVGVAHTPKRQKESFFARLMSGMR
jgi:flagellar biosynthesis protein FlhG